MVAMTSLFDGEVVADAVFPALERICIAFNISGPRFMDRQQHLIETMQRHHDPSVPDRIWWHYLEGRSEAWISINPGEFRRRPPAPPCIIREVPGGMPEVGAHEMLRAAIATCRQIRPLGSHEHRLLAAAGDLLAKEIWGVPPALYEDIQACRGLSDQAQYQARFQSLYADHFDTLKCTIDDFSICILILQFQVRLNLWIDDDWQADPAAALQSLFAHVLDGDHREPAVAAMRERAKRDYDLGRTRVKDALAGAEAALPRRLMYALHCFAMAHKVIEALIHAGVDGKDLPVQPVLAEEALACTWAGLHSGAHFCLDAPDSLPQQLYDECGNSLSALRARSRESSSEIWPVFARRFADLLAAHGLTRSPLRADIVQGLEEFQRLRTTFTDLAALERGWLDHASLRALKAIGDAHGAEVVATRIAGKLVSRISSCDSPTLE